MLIKCRVTDDTPLSKTLKINYKKLMICFHNTIHTLFESIFLLFFYSSVGKVLSIVSVFCLIVSIFGTELNTKYSFPKMFEFFIWFQLRLMNEIPVLCLSVSLTFKLIFIYFCFKSISERKLFIDFSIFCSDLTQTKT